MSTPTGERAPLKFSMSAAAEPTTWTLREPVVADLLGGRDGAEAEIRVRGRGLDPIRVPAAAGHRVEPVARTRELEGVVVSLSVDGVVAGVAGDRVVAVATVDGVVAGTAEHDVGVLAARQGVVRRRRRRCRRRSVSVTAVKFSVSALPAAARRGARRSRCSRSTRSSAIAVETDGRVGGRGHDHVIAGCAVDVVEPVAGTGELDGVVSVTAVDGVVAGRHRR